MVETATSDLKLADPPWVDDSHVRRIRALLRTGPLHELEGSKALRDGDWSPYDLRGLALVAIDTVIDHMGLDLGATATQVRERLATLARQAAPDRPAQEAERVAEAVLEGLLNDRHRREAFAMRYSDWTGRTHRRAEVAFKLLEETEAPDGSIVLRATDEAVNLFVGALDRDIQDAQAAAEAVLASQLRRGMVDQAVHTARAARLRSIQFAARVQRVLDTTRHDIRQVDWNQEVPELLAHALAHLGERLEVERRLVTTARELIAGGDAGPAGATLLELIEDCQLRHLELHALLLDARTTFLEEQERQTFAVSSDSRALELSEQLLQPLLAQPQRVARPVAERFLQAVTGPVAPRPVRLTDLVEVLFQPRRGGEDEDLVDDEPDLVDGADDRRYPPSAWQVAGEVFTMVAIGGGRRLSELLQLARQHEPQATELIALSVLHAYAPERTPPEFQAINDGRTLDDPEFGGDDLLVGPPAATP
jgi:hypothetical protein